MKNSLVDNYGKPVVIKENVLKQMINIYKPNGIDWMGYCLKKDSPYTFHHIMEDRNGGKKEIKNGAILTLKAHVYLNYLERFCPEAYDEYQKLFRYINDLEGPIDNDLYQEICELALDINFENGFTFRNEPAKIYKKKRNIQKEKDKKEKTLKKNNSYLIKR